MSEIRYDRLKDRYVIVEPGRAKRPFEKFEIKKFEKSYESIFAYGKEHLTPPEIYAVREDGSKPNSPGWKIRVIPNKYPALKNEIFRKNKKCIFESFNGYGFHEIVIETPDICKQFESFTIDEFYLLLKTYQKRLNSLYENEYIQYVHIFKNRGYEAGASILHSHSQILALPYIPTQIKTILNQSEKYFSKKNRCLLCDEIKCEQKEKSRVIYENEKYILYAPFASFYPYEMKIVPKNHFSDFGKCDKKDIKLLSEIFKEAFLRLEKIAKEIPFNLILVSLPKKTDEAEKYFHWHFEILPRINIFGGFEHGTLDTINVVEPEKAAEFLKNIKVGHEKSIAGFGNITYRYKKE
ncbi:galactose-1-phosphate uridylyltransferase [Nitrosophilus kaiyonis]|uniref:galactose-1-phosphate uridylyltransferase n=1 Tax=Nitrosophilus kaiyonis TaxID=2930200 RepID=UPI002491B40C|nr:galactose-1-phosphate uridylyltransferase [Nitrosophilus kaiyonis]